MKTVSFQRDILPLKDILYRLALRITLNREDAEDIVQETLIKCWNRRDTLHELDSIAAYATTICRNLALDCTKRASRHTASTEDKAANGAAASAADISDNPLERLLNQERLTQIREAIDSLPEKHKLCLQLRDFEEKSYKEIAETLGISEQQVKTNIFRARQALKKVINDRHKAATDQH